MVELKIEPFTADVAQSDLDELRRRLIATRWAPGQPLGTDPGTYGVSTDRVGRLVAKWTDFDWRAWKERINALPQFRTVIDRQPVHFVHVRSGEPDALPVMLTHGWPGSVFEYVDLVDRLTDPVAHGANQSMRSTSCFPHCPVTASPGRALTPGWGTRRIAQAWAQLMARLGYEQYGAIGNDAGSRISPELGRLEPDRVLGVHVTQLFSFPRGDPAEMADLSIDEQAGLDLLPWFWKTKGAFNALQAQQPQTLAHALCDSPAGLLGWNSQLFDESVDDDFILANVSLYWLTGTAGTSIRHYYEDTHADAAPAPPGPTIVPTGLAAAADGDFRSIRRFAERDHAGSRRGMCCPASPATTAPARTPTSWPPTSASSLGRCGSGRSPSCRAAPKACPEPTKRAATMFAHQTREKSTMFTVMTEALDLLRAAGAAVTNDQRHLPSPCSEWTVTQVLQHAAGDQLAWAAALGTGAGPDYNPFEPSGTHSGSVDELLAPAIALAETVWSGVGEQDTAVPTPLPQGALPAGTAAAACALDAAIHAWDVTAALGLPSTLTTDLAAQLLPTAREIVELLRQYGAYGPEVTPQPGQDAADELLRYLGRDPHWQA